MKTIKSFGKIIAAIGSLCFTCAVFTGCASRAETKEAVPESETVCTDGGKVLNIYCWNTEFEERMTDYYPGYKDHGDGTGSIGDVKVV